MQFCLHALAFIFSLTQPSSLLVLLYNFISGLTPLIHPPRIVLHILKTMLGKNGISDSCAITRLTVYDYLLILLNLIKVLFQSANKQVVSTLDMTRFIFGSTSKIDNLGMICF